MPPAKLTKTHGSHHSFKNVSQDKRALERLNPPPCIKTDIGYHLGYIAGYREKNTPWAFFSQFPELLFRSEGSALPRCWIEVSLATSIGLVVSLLSSDVFGVTLIHDDWGTIGHSTVGIVLSFLLVQRSQIAWSLYLQGYSGIFGLRAAILNLARITIGGMVRHEGWNTKRNTQTPSLFLLICDSLFP